VAHVEHVQLICSYQEFCLPRQGMDELLVRWTCVHTYLSICWVIDFGPPPKTNLHFRWRRWRWWPQQRKLNGWVEFLGGGMMGLKSENPAGLSADCQKFIYLTPKKLTQTPGRGRDFVPESDLYAWPKLDYNWVVIMRQQNGAFEGLRIPWTPFLVPWTP